MCGAAAGAIDQDQQARGRLFILIAVSSLTDSKRNTGRSYYGDCRPNGCWPDDRSRFFEMLIPFEVNRIPNTQIKKNNKRLLPRTLILLCALNPTTTMLATPALPGQDNQHPSSFNSCRADQSFVCLQDDDSGDILQSNSCAGDYQFTRCGAGGFTLIGRGEIGRVGNLLTLQDSKVSATVDAGPIAPRGIASAVIKRTPLGPTFVINDSDTTNNTCSCR